jgi:hypothetical protein
VTCPISADAEFSIEIGSVADLKIEIVNKITNHVDIVSAQAPNLLNIKLWCRRRTFLCVLGLFWWPIIKFEIRLVANFGDGNRKSKSALSLIFF